jgi:ATP-binding cassette, subfamily B, bacterial PglK
MLNYTKEILFVLGDRKSRAVLILFLFIFSAIIDLAGLGMIIPYVSIMVSPDNLLNEDIINLLSFLGLSTDRDKLFVELGLLLVFIFFIKGLVGYFVNFTIIKFSALLTTSLQDRLMFNYLLMPYENFLMNNNSYYMSVIQSRVSQFSAVITSLLKLISDMILSFSIFALLFISSPYALLLISSLLIGFSLLYGSIFGKKLIELGRVSGEYTGLLIRGVNEGLTGIKDIRIYGKEKHFLNMVHDGARNSARINIKTQTIQSIPRLALEFIIIIFIVSLSIGSFLLGFNMIELAPVFALFGLASVRLIPIIVNLTNSINQIRYGRAATSVLFEDFSSQVQEMDLSKVDSSHNNMNFDKFTKLSLNNVSYRYPNTNSDAIKDVTMSINIGDTIGVIGKSGSGKSTFVNLLIGFLEPQNGSITYNDNPLRNNYKKWIQKIAYLPQNIFISDDTIKHNIAIGEKDSEIDNNKIIKSLKQANLYSLVNKLPDGVNTFVGEDGIRLSGGQRQRIGIARAFYFEREVLIYDEATSSLDKELEKEIIAEVGLLKNNKTIIIITHELSILSNCNRIYRIDDGKIIQEGEYKDVIG